MVHREPRGAGWRHGHGKCITLGVIGFFYGSSTGMFQGWREAVCIGGYNVRPGLLAVPVPVFSFFLSLISLRRGVARMGG